MLKLAFPSAEQTLGNTEVWLPVVDLADEFTAVFDPEIHRYLSGDPRNHIEQTLDIGEASAISMNRQRSTGRRTRTGDLQPQTQG